MTQVRPDHRVIADRIFEGARVLDVGCGSGDLLDLLQQEKSVAARGLELSPDGVANAVARGLSVVQGNADTDLAMYPDDAFDYAILSKTIQEMRSPAAVLSDLARIAPVMMVSFRNYGHWRNRMTLAISGRSPSPRGRQWFDADSLHPCTLRDVSTLAALHNLTVKSITGISKNETRKLPLHPGPLTGLFAEDLVFEIVRT